MFNFSQGHTRIYLINTLGHLTIKISCPVFRRVLARMLDMLLPILITTLFSFIYLLTKYVDKNIREITLTKDEMILISLVNVLLFSFFFLIVPSSNKGRTIFKHALGIKVEIESRATFTATLLREMFITLLPSLIVLLLPFTFSEKEFASLFIGEFAANWASSLSTLGYRVAFFVFAILYFLSAVMVFITKKRKTIYDFIGSTWVYTEEKKNLSAENAIEPKKKTRPGGFLL